ncbi:MAG: TIGR00282 family metallophosphoesterase [Patescibacteria group bacterium]
MKFLFLGDVVGKLGRQAVTSHLPQIRKKEKIDFSAVNGENLTHGRGASLKHLRELKEAGVDFFTSGDHVFYLDPHEPFSDPNIDIIRPANLPQGTPGKGYKVFSFNGKKIAIINLLGLTFLGDKLREDKRNENWLKGEVGNPFGVGEEIVAKLKEKEKPDLIFVDFHCEATSEKRALGLFLDGQVTAVLGSHTHVPTADAQILPQGTAYVSDIGMTGSRDSVLGVEAEIIISRLKEGKVAPFAWVEKGPTVLGAVMVETDKANKVKRIERKDFIYE